MTSFDKSSVLRPVDLSAYADGNTGVPYAHRFESGSDGPDVLVTAIVHGNELCGAHALARLLELGIRPVSGALTVCFCNIDAYLSFDPTAPARARFVEEDFNRVWDQDTLDSPRLSAELDRARQIRPLLDRAEILLDLHSMQTHAEPLMLTGLDPVAEKLARSVGFPLFVVADPGHASGRRMRDYADFGTVSERQKVALLAECGQHLEPEAATNAIEVLARFLLTVGCIDAEAAERLSPLPDRPATRTIEVTERVTVRNGSFHFSVEPETLGVVPEKGTVLGTDGDEPVRTPYDDCVLIMPSRRLTTGQTAVRLGRFRD